jgi:hypothetical protein
MNEEKLHNIRQTLVKSRSKMNKSLLFTGFFSPAIQYFCGF